MANPFEGLDFSNLFGAAAPAAPEPDPFGRIGAGDPGWESARGAWMSGATLRDLFGDSLFDLNGTVGTGHQNQRGDVFKVQALLHREGKLDAEATGGPTGYWGNRDDAALRDLQKDNGLAVDGWAGPQGETIGHLRDLYRPPQGVQLGDVGLNADRDDAGQREAVRNANRELTATLGLDPEKIDLDDIDTMRALGATRFYGHMNRQQQYEAMRDIQKLGRVNPELAGRLTGMVADSIANPVWQIPMLTPERLQQAIGETTDGLKMMEILGMLGGGGRDAWKQHRPPGAPKVIDRGLNLFRSGGTLLRRRFETTLDKLETEQMRRNAP